MIDLSFLTEEEQETILAVLRRDAVLKKAEEQRVQNLQTTVRDRSQLKYLTGEWFYEIKQLRHQDRIHGSDIIMASMRHTHKPLTILELSHILPEKSSFVSSANEEVFVPPVLRGLLQEPRANNESYKNQTRYDMPQENPVVQSPTKRKNPFNNEFNASHRGDGASCGAADQAHTTDKGFSEHCHWDLSPALLGLVSAEETGKLVSLETEAEEAEATHAPDGDTVYQGNLSEPSTDVSIQLTSYTIASLSCGSAGFSNAVSTQQRPGTLRRFSRESSKSAAVQSKPKEDLHTSEQKETSNTHELFQDSTDTAVDTSVSDKHGAPHPDKIGVKTLQLAALQNTAFKETVTTAEPCTQQEVTEGRIVQFPGKLSNLKAFWERENAVPQTIFTGEQAKQEDMCKDPQMCLDNMSNMLALKEITDEVVTARSQEPTQLNAKCSLSALLKEDVAYRANPVVIYEETDESLTGTGNEPQISEAHENICIPLTSSGVPVSLPSQSTSSPQGARPAKIRDLKHFWEKEYKGPRVIVARVREASHLDNRKTSDKEEHTSGTKSTDVLKSLKVTDKGFVSPDTVQPMRSDRMHAGDVHTKERSISPSQCHIPRSKDQNDEVRRSPSKTCHPRVLPTESSSPKRSRIEGSPLKTFPIDIQTKGTKDQQEKPTTMSRQKNRVSREVKQTVLTDTKPFTDVIAHPLHSVDTETYFDNANHTQECSSSSSTIKSQKSPEKLMTFTQLARSFLPLDYQHYLGPQEKAHFPPFQQEKTAYAETESVHRPEKALRDVVGNQSESLNEWDLPMASSGGVQSKIRKSSQNTTRAWSRASSDSYDGSSNPILSALSSGNMSSSKSLENLTTQTREERTKNDSDPQLTLSVDGASSAAPLSNAKQTKTSLSVPVLQQDGIEIDLTSEENLGWRRNTGSSMSNLSLSSGMASISSNEQVSGSISSIYTPDGGDVEVQGSIQFALNYIQKLGEFHMFVVHCRDLAVADTKRNRSDPYVKCYLLPDKIKLGKRKTTIKKKTLNPTYNEILKFSVSMEVLKTLNLNISVWHNDTFGRNIFLGEVDLDLSEWDFSNTQINEYALKNRVSTQTLSMSPSHLMDSKGQMRVALRFVSQMSHSNRTSVETGEVQIWVKDCKNLPSVRGVTIDPFVKCTVLPDTSRKSRQKTRVVKRTANPMFNHTMVYNGFRPEDLREVCVELTVWDHDRLNNHYIGGMRLGLGTGKSYGVDVVWMDSAANEAHLWQRMLQSGSEWVEDVLPLRMFVIAKSISK